jgi:1-acyl-sn-glycerol-3-phosphate acyltransferase
MTPVGPHLQAVLRALRALSHYFRYECRGFEHVAQREASLVVAYHGRPWPIDVLFLAERMHRELGYLPRAIFGEALRRLPIARELIAELRGFYNYPEADDVAELRARGQHLVVLPGGGREAFRPCWVGRRVDWGVRRGYLRLAWRYRLPIVPVAASGVDHLYLGLNDGYRLSRRLFGHGHSSGLWLALGLGGPWPLGLPWPVKIRQRVGAPIRLEAIRKATGSEHEFYAEAHRAVAGAVQRLLDAG